MISPTSRRNVVRLRLRSAKGCNMFPFSFVYTIPTFLAVFASFGSPDSLGLFVVSSLSSLTYFSLFAFMPLRIWFLFTALAVSLASASSFISSFCLYLFPHRFLSLPATSLPFHPLFHCRLILLPLIFSLATFLAAPPLFCPIPLPTSPMAPFSPFLHYLFRVFHVDSNTWPLGWSSYYTLKVAMHGIVLLEAYGSLQTIPTSLMRFASYTLFTFLTWSQSSSSGSPTASRGRWRRKVSQRTPVDRCGRFRSTLYII